MAIVNQVDRLILITQLAVINSQFGRVDNNSINASLLK
ncbi:hypothetical protein BMETH_2552_0 [methanotrophic bacterial endosymbiont of Bathymodiolus sp.]|jgi:hypothetical protein|nr:hypothetical protein BMETH_2552_0 [methanotrophic bacterial endosymbiont of Bathymodiolus sp.]